MIEVYSFPTPNGQKVHIMLEEVGLPYELHPVDIRRGEQFAPAFLRINPNNKIPAIVDSDGPGQRRIALFESGAILIYLAEKTGKLLSVDAHQRYDTLQWLMFQMAGVGPMFGQANHFLVYAPEKIPYAMERYAKEAERLYRVLNNRLADRQFVAGDYSIADIALYPWARTHERLGVSMTDFVHVQRWLETISGRPAVKRGLEVLAELRNTPVNDAESKANLFGAKQWRQGDAR